MPYDDNGPIEPFDSIIYAFIGALPVILAVIVVGYILYIILLTIITVVDKPYHKR